MTFVDLDLARRIEAADCDLCSEVARIASADGDTKAGVWALAGGAAVYAGPDSPCNKLVGLGLDGAPDDAELAAVEAVLHERGVGVVRAEVSSLAGATAASLSARGYVLQGFECVLGRRLDGGLGDATSSLVVERCDDHDREAWIDALIEGFAHADEGTPHEEFPREVLVRTFDQMARGADFRRYVVRHEGIVVGAATLRLHRGIAQLCGTATVPAMRRRGVQTAFVQRRLADARAAGCDLAVVTTAPGSKSQENLMRAGFELLMVRAILERPRRA